jgi:hypothetical protein
LLWNRLGTGLHLEAFLAADALVESPEQRGQPPCALAEQPQAGGEQKATHEDRVGEHGDRGADAEDLEHDDVRAAEGADRDREQDGGGGDDAADDRDAAGDRPTIALTAGAEVAGGVSGG